MCYVYLCALRCPLCLCKQQFLFVKILIIYVVAFSWITDPKTALLKLEILYHIFTYQGFFLKNCRLFY